MRAMSAADVARYANGFFRVKVEVEDAGSTWRDLSTLPTFNAIRSVDWGEDVDSPGMTADVTFWRNLDAISLSPLHETSPINRTTPFDAGGSFSALLSVNRRLRISWALLPDDRETPSTWTKAFEGVISKWSEPDDESITVECRGQYAELQDRLFEEEFVFAFAASLLVPYRIFQPGTAYALNDRILPTDSKANARFYKCTTAGTTGATEPTWPGAGTVASGSAVFTYEGVTTPTAGIPVADLMSTMAWSVIPLGTARFGDPTSPGDYEVVAPTSPGWNVNVFQVRRDNVWNEMEALAQQIAWDFRWKWDSVEADFRLMIYDPQRSKTTPDFVFQFGQQGLRDYKSISVDVANIRNVVCVIYSDASDLDPQKVPKRKKVTVTDSASVSAYGRRYMEVGEASASNIDSAAEATVMANGMLSDLAQPVADLEAEVRFFPWVELTDLYGFPADGRRFTSQQNLAVTGYRHHIEAGQGSTSIRVRGKPATGNRRWNEIATPANPGDNHRLLSKGISEAASLTVTPSLRGTQIQVDPSGPITKAIPREIEVHVSTASGFTPSSATLKAFGRQQQFLLSGLKPGVTHFTKFQTYGYNAERLVRSEPSEETSFVAGYIEPSDLNPERVAQPLPPNGSFEGWFTDDTVPPDHWEADTGTWADWARSTTAGDGAYSIECRDLGSAIRAELRSAWFPAEAGKSYALRALLQRLVSDGDVRLTIEWGDSAKASLSSVTLATNTAGMTNFTASRQLVAEAPAGTRFARVKVGRDTASTLRFRVDAVSLRCVGEALVPVTYSDANWIDWGGGFTGVGYWRGADGLIHIRGLAKTNVARAIGATIFTLPTGFRPAAQEIFTMQGPGGLVRVDVAAAGNVYLQTALNAGDWVALSGIKFDVR